MMSTNNFDDKKRILYKIILDLIYPAIINGYSPDEKTYNQNIKKIKKILTEKSINILQESFKLIKNNILTEEKIDFSTLQNVLNISNDELDVLNNCFNDLWNRIENALEENDYKVLKNLRHNNLGMHNGWSYLLN